MPLVSSRELLLAAQKGGYAVGAFNIENMEMAQAVIEAAQSQCAPVILQSTPSTVKYASVNLFYGMVNALAENCNVPVALHLDHGNSFELAKDAIGAGYTSIMIDGSHESFEENIALTKKVIDAATGKNIPVEAELGKVGGKEDDLDGGDGGYTNPKEAREFVEKTNVASLAVAIGTAHGFYSGTPKLDVLRLAQIHEMVSIPLVLHGASGLLNEDIQECIKHGICKVNFATELRVAYSEGVKEYIELNPDVFDPKQYGASGREKVKELVIDRIKVCGCDGKAK